MKKENFVKHYFTYYYDTYSYHMYTCYEIKNFILPFIFNCMTLLSPGLISFFASHIYFPSLALLVCKNSKVPFLKKFTLGSYKKSLYSSIESPKI